jgi:hypothetical protein
MGLKLTLGRPVEIGLSCSGTDDEELPRLWSLAWWTIGRPGAQAGRGEVAVVMAKADLSIRRLTASERRRRRRRRR